MSSAEPVVGLFRAADLPGVLNGCLVPATQYSDGAGNSWSGFGPKPGWLKDALAAGRTLEDLAGPPKD